MQRVIPMLPYEEGSASMDWLIKAFGFEEKERWLDESGRLTHGELSIGGEVIMLAAPAPDYQSPKRVRANYQPAQEWSKVPYIFNGVLVYVEDVDAVYRMAVVAGAIILSQIEDGFPGRRFRAEDLEGQRWSFMQTQLP